MDEFSDVSTYGLHESFWPSVTRRVLYKFVLRGRAEQMKMEGPRPALRRGKIALAHGASPYTVDAFASRQTPQYGRLNAAEMYVDLVKESGGMASQWIAESVGCLLFLWFSRRALWSCTAYRSHGGH
eukprot:1157491-Pelagomonas_calceolata.AAC.13